MMLLLTGAGDATAAGWAAARRYYSHTSFLHLLMKVVKALCNDKANMSSDQSMCSQC
jgi:hypothetical protein